MVYIFLNLSFFFSFFTFGHRLTDQVKVAALLLYIDITDHAPPIPGTQLLHDDAQCGE